MQPPAQAGAVAAAAWQSRAWPVPAERPAPSGRLQPRPRPRPRHGRAALAAGAAAVLARPERGLRSSIGRGGGWQGPGGREHPEPGAPQGGAEWSRAPAHWLAKDPAAKTPSLPQGPHAFLMQGHCLLASRLQELDCVSRSPEHGLPLPRWAGSSARPPACPAAAQMELSAPRPPRLQRPRPPRPADISAPRVWRPRGHAALSRLTAGAARCLLPAFGRGDRGLPQQLGTGRGPGWQLPRALGWLSPKGRAVEPCAPGSGVSPGGGGRALL